MIKFQKTNRAILYAFIVLLAFIASGQELAELQSWNGEYHLMQPERSVQPGKTTTDFKKLEIGENNGTILLGTAECDRCTPTVFTYQSEISHKINKPVFFNSAGLYMIAIDTNSFVYYMVSTMLGKGAWDTLYFANYYSKDKQKTQAMTKEKLSEIAMQIASEAGK